MKCGVLWVKRKSHGGCGMPSIMGQGKVLAYVFGRRPDEVFLQLRAQLEPFGLTRFFTDQWVVYARRLAPETHVPGQCNTQQIEGKPLTLRTCIKRWARKTLGFSKSIELHDIVIELFVNRYEVGLSV